MRLSEDVSTVVIVSSSRAQMSKASPFGFATSGPVGYACAYCIDDFHRRSSRP